MLSNNIIHILVEYLNSQDESLLNIHYSIQDKSSLNSACIELLSWLKLERKRELWITEGRKTKLKPMELNTNYEWYHSLIDLIENNTSLNSLFEIKNMELNFKESISDETKAQLRKDAYELYNAPRFE